ncbi:hypothetical protein [Nocardioides caricicola]|uniref:Uncharacterized protein n=1 Tax=Nocardioides caricicola TaxID=634770 RepID=A0ABW0N066_9ACTN
MKRLGPVVVAAAALLLVAAPAQAQEVTIADPQGDSRPAALDIISVTARNLDKSVVATMTFPSTTDSSDIIVSVDPRGGTGVRMVSRFQPAGLGTTKNYVLRKAFPDRGHSNKRVACRGLKFREGMSDAGPTITLRMPSTCLNDGNYGALRFAVLIERGPGDADWAPGTGGSTAWVPRG